MYSKSSMIGVMIVLLVLISSTIMAQEFTFSGDASVVTSYVFRGLRQFEGAAVQGTLVGSVGMVSFGMWYSNVDFGDGSIMETDPFVEVSLPAGALTSTIGLGYYTYDFKKINESAKGEFEFYAILEYGALSANAFFAPKQKSTELDLNDTSYWFVVDYSKEINDYRFTMAYEFGTYSSRFLETPKKNAVHFLDLGVEKSINEQLSLSWKIDLPTDPDLKTVYWAGLTIGF